MKQKLVRHGRKLSLLATCAILAACGGGSGGGDNVGGREQFITMDYPGGGELGQVTKLVATTTSGLPVTFSASTPDFCSVSGDQLTLIKSGECRVVASQAGGKDSSGVTWAPADNVSQLFTVKKHIQKPDLPYVVMLRSGSTTVELSATTRAGLPATYASTTPTVCTVSGKTLTVKSIGFGIASSCVLSVTAPGNDENYPLAPDTGTGTSTATPTPIGAAATAVIGVVETPPFVIAGQGFAQTVVLASVDADGKAMSYESKSPAVCAVSGGTLRLTSKGLCTVTASIAGGGTEELKMFMDPRYFATGFDSKSSNPSRTLQQGDIVTNAGFSAAWGCPAVTPSFCNTTVTPLFAGFSWDIKPAQLGNWNGSVDWQYFNFEIGAPMASSGGSLVVQPFDLKTEESLYVPMAVNKALVDDGVFVRIQTNHKLKKADGSDCYVAVSQKVFPKASGVVDFPLALADFAVTEKCESADLPKTEDWMFNWGVTAESKAAALKELRTYGIRRLMFAPGNGLNVTRPTPLADGSIPTDKTSPDYTLSTTIMVFAPITVQ